MDMNQVNVEAIVKSVLEDMLGQQGSAHPAKAGAAEMIPATAKVAMLTELEKYEIKEKTEYVSC